MKQKQFLYIDLSGRGYNATYTYSEMLGLSGFLNEVDDNTEVILSEWIIDCHRGDMWQSNSIKMICTQ